MHVLFSLDPSRVKHTLNDYLWSKCKIEEAAYDVTDSVVGKADESGRTRLFLVPSAIDTGAIAKILREGYDVGMLNDGLNELADRLKLDVLLIDTHPGVNEETLLSIAISDLLLLIMRPDNQDFQGTAVTAELARRPRRQKDVADGEQSAAVDGSRSASPEGGKTSTAWKWRHPAAERRNRQRGQRRDFYHRYPQHPFTRCLVQVVDRVLECLA